MTAILGISAFYHDSAAALVVDGGLVAAAQEERFTRKKHDHSFPENAIAYCLREWGGEAGGLDYIGFYDKPFLKFERILETYISYAPRGFSSFLCAIPLWLKQKLYIRKLLRKQFPEFDRRFVFTSHHESHAASAFFPSPFEDAAILTLDGVGEWTTAGFGTGRGNRIALQHELRFPHSLGLLYSAFTYFCGFKVNSGEYKLMGLAPYGEPVYYDTIMEKLLDLKPDGSFAMDMSFFNYCRGLTMTSRRFDRLFAGPPRRKESQLTQREMDLAASVQKATETIMMRMVEHVHKETGMQRLCLAGGVALNCVGNGRILREGPFEKLWIQPAAGDAGGALGTALFIWHQLLGNERGGELPDGQKGSLCGPSFTNDEIRSFLEEEKAVYHYVEDEEELLERTAGLIAEEQVVGWMQGRMEFGPRALGCRSILADARSAKMQSLVNRKIKFRESFRPFAPSVLEEEAPRYFELNEPSPYMLLVADVASSKRTDGAAVRKRKGLDKLKTVRSVIPAVTHVDYSARIQTVDQHRHGRYYKLLKRFEKKTGCPVVINTSFNVRGEPIVCSPADAYRCFMVTGMDVLVMENCLLYKKEQPDREKYNATAYLDQFALD